jgi:predicted metalloendopeptidase
LEDDKIKKSHQLKNLYQSFLTTKDKEIEQEIKNSISTLHYLREKGDIYDFLSWFFSSGFSPLFSWYIGIDEKNPTKYISYFQESDLFLKTKNMYHSNSNTNVVIRGKYKKFIEEMFSTIFGKNNLYNVSNILEIEKELSQYYYDEKDSVNFDKLYNVYSKNKIFSDFDFDWDQFLISLGIKKEEIDSVPLKTVILNPNYFKHVIKLLKMNWD